MKLSNKNLTVFSQKLRREMTKEEKHLWYDFLRFLPMTVHRQKTCGAYILDFYIAKHKLAIELDGSQHYEEEAMEYDRKRDEYLNEMGITVARYLNCEVNNNFRDVCDDIKHRLNMD